MPTSAEAVKVFHENDVLYAPGKAANAGGVAVSGLEMTQNATHSERPKEAVDQKTQKIMKHIFDQCHKYGKSVDHINLAKGANIAGFIRVADALIDQGVF